MNLFCKMEFISILEEEPRVVGTYHFSYECNGNIPYCDDDGKFYDNYKTDFPGIYIKCTFFEPLADSKYMRVEPEKLKLGE